MADKPGIRPNTVYVLTFPEGFEYDEMLALHCICEHYSLYACIPYGKHLFYLRSYRFECSNDVAEAAGMVNQLEERSLAVSGIELLVLLADSVRMSEIAVHMADLKLQEEKRAQLKKEWKMRRKVRDVSPIRHQNPVKE